MHPNLRPWAQCSNIHSNLCLASINLVCNSLVANMHMAIFKCSFNQFYNLDFIKFTMENVFSSSTFLMIWTMASLATFMNSKKQTTNRLFVASWHHNLVNGFASLVCTMALETWFFMVNFKKGESTLKGDVLGKKINSSFSIFYIILGGNISLISSSILINISNDFGTKASNIIFVIFQMKIIFQQTFFFQHTYVRLNEKLVHMFFVKSHEPNSSIVIEMV